MAQPAITTREKRKKPNLAPITVPQTDKPKYHITDSGTFSEGDFTISREGLVIGNTDSPANSRPNSSRGSGCSTVASQSREVLLAPREVRNSHKSIPFFLYGKRCVVQALAMPIQCLTRKPCRCDAFGVLACARRWLVATFLAALLTLTCFPISSVFPDPRECATEDALEVHERVGVMGMGT